MDDHHSKLQLLWAALIALLLGSVGAGYYLLNNADELKDDDMTDDAVALIVATHRKTSHTVTIPAPSTAVKGARKLHG